MFKAVDPFTRLMLSSIKKELAERKIRLDILDHPNKGSKGTEYFRVSVFDDVTKREINFDTFENKFSTTFVTPLIVGVYMGLELAKVMARPMYNVKRQSKVAKELTNVL